MFQNNKEKPNKADTIIFFLPSIKSICNVENIYLSIYLLLYIENTKNIKFSPFD